MFKVYAHPGSNSRVTGKRAEKNPQFFTPVNSIAAKVGGGNRITKGIKSLYNLLRGK